MRLKIDRDADALYLRLDDSPIMESEEGHVLTAWVTLLASLFSHFTGKSASRRVFSFITKSPTPALFRAFGNEAENSALCLVPLAFVSKSVTHAVSTRPVAAHPPAAPAGPPGVPPRPRPPPPPAPRR